MDNLCSIVIPIYNRALIVHETLDSILAQTFTKWECIIVDDGSTDNTEEVIRNYIKKDNRFQFHNRTTDRMKGANSCRNIGIEKCKGKFVVFFDSDDLMTPDHLKLKIENISNSSYDYVITRTAFYNKDNTQINNYYRFDQFNITPYNYVTQKINWLTYDICLKSDRARNINFNENLQSGQEYNYFCKLVHITTNAKFIDEVLTLRRHHENSIRSQLKTKFQINESKFRAKWFTYLDIKHCADNDVKIYFMLSISSLIMEERTFYGQSRFNVLSHLYSVIGFKSIYLILYLTSMKVFRKGYYFRKKLK